MAKVGEGGGRSAGSDLAAGRAAGGGRTIGIIAAVSGTCARLSRLSCGTTGAPWRGVRLVCQPASDGGGLRGSRGGEPGRACGACGRVSALSGQRGRADTRPLPAG